MFAVKGKYSSIAVDYSDVVHISFVQDDNNDLRPQAIMAHGRFQWQLNQAGTGISIAADSNGDLHIVYKI